jgi:hypothetical protein
MTQRWESPMSERKGKTVNFYKKDLLLILYPGPLKHKNGASETILSLSLWSLTFYTFQKKKLQKFLTWGHGFF